MHSLAHCLIQAATPLLVALPFLFLTAPAAQSTPVVWALNNAVFNDGGQAYGSFVYDDDTHTITSADITTTTGSNVQFDTHYDASIVDSHSTASHPAFWNGFFTSDYSYTEWYELDFPLTQAMTNAGGEIPLALGQGKYNEAFVFGLHLTPPAYCDFCVDRQFVSGSLVGQSAFFDSASMQPFASAAFRQEASATPEPSTLALISVALCSFGAWGRRHRSRAIKTN